jgi:hypothetical protein
MAILYQGMLNTVIVVFYLYHKFFAIGIILALNQSQNRTIMKNSTKTTVILKALDMELKALIKADLENFKLAHSGQKQSQVQQAA